MNNEKRDEVIYIHLDDIIPNRFQPREVFEEKALKELAVSIKEHGVIQPIIVRSVKGKYEIIAGERRYKASALAGLTKIPAIVRNLDDKESSKVALLENLQRKNLTPIEEARTYQKIIEIDEMTQEELAKTMGKSQSAVSNKLRLLTLCDEVQQALLKEQISERHARALLNIKDPKQQKDMLKKIITNKMSVRAVEQEIEKVYGSEKEPVEEKEEKEDVVIENSLSDAFKMDSSINTASINDFVNNSPLMPTEDFLKIPDDNYGKVTIAPPEGEEMPENANKFINFTNESKSESNFIKPSNMSSSPSSGTDLDSLLKFEDKEEEIPEPPPADKPLVKETKKEEAGDYFSTPDMPLNFPTDFSDITSSSSKSISDILKEDDEKEENKPYTINEATTKIKNLVDEIKKHGLKVTADEMDFSKSYQIIIKIDKEEE